jgi:hypothetical protein
MQITAWKDLENTLYQLYVKKYCLDSTFFW